MIIACPRCATPYTVDAALFGAAARVVQCSACDCRWTQPAKARLAAGEATAFDAAAADFDADFDAGDSLPEMRVAEVDDVDAPPIVPSAAMVEAASPTMEAVAAGDESDPPAEAETAVGDDAAVVSPAAGPQADPAAGTPPAPVTPGESGQARRRLHLGRGRGFVAATAAAATVIALASLLLVLRQPIMTLLPASAGFYGRLGLAPDPLGAGLEIRGIASVRERHGGEDVLTVSGVVANVVQRPAPLPAIRVSLFDAADDELQFVTLPSERPSLSPGETLRFDARITDPRPEARRVRVGFAPAPSS